MKFNSSRFTRALLYKICAILFALQCGLADVSAQTGPGGVGNATTNKIWLDASHITILQNNDAVQTWLDRSGNNWNANQPNFVNRPRYQINKLNGRPAISFSRTSAPQFLQVTSAGVGAVMSNSHTSFAVSQAHTAGAGGIGDQGLYQIVFTMGAGWISGTYYIGTSTSTIRNEATTWLGGNGDLPTRDLRSSASVPINRWNISTQWVNESASSTNLRGFFNGAPQGNSTHATLIANYSAFDKVTVGAYAGSGWMSALNGDIAEVILFSVALNDPERIIVNNYLGAKYNINVASDYYFANDPSFIRDVQGIGTTTGLAAQKHTHAANSRGLQLTELNNSLNSTNEFLLVGHASDENSWTIDPQSNGYSRWQRSWYLSRNATIDAKLGFDFSQAGVFPEGDISTNTSSFRLLYRATLSAPFAVVQSGGQPLIPTFENGDQLAFSLTSSQLPNGYYTLAYVASLTWTGAVDKQWNNAGNWNMNRIPTPGDFVHIGECTDCPTLNGGTIIKGLYLTDQGKLDIANYQLTVSGTASFSGAEVVSDGGAIKAADYIQIKNSAFTGKLTLEKNGGGVNNCHGGNTFSPGIKINNSSGNDWTITQLVDNVILKL